MKKNLSFKTVRLYIYCFLILSIQISFSQTHSVLSQGVWKKITVNSPSIYKVDYNYITSNLGLDVSAANFSQIAIFGNGGGPLPELNSANYPSDLQENAVYRFDANSNNKMDAGDFILFWGEGADDIRFNSGDASFYYKKNIYANENYYFLTTTQGTGKSITTIPSDGGSNKDIYSTQEIVHHEDESDNPGFTGQVWLGDKMTNFSASKSFDINLTHRKPGSAVTIKSAVAQRSLYPATMQVLANGISLINHSIPNTTDNQYGSYYGYNQITQSFFPTSDNLNIQYNYINSDPNNNAQGWIDYFEFEYSRDLNISHTPFIQIRNSTSIGSGFVTTYHITSANSSTQLWDVSTPWNVQQISGNLTGSNLTVTRSSDIYRELVVVDLSNSFPSPGTAYSVSNQDIHGLGQPDLVIVTHPDFIQAAERLAQFHQNESGITAVTLALPEIYNEFSNGRPDITAIRNYMRMLFKRAGNADELPKYLCLFGTGSFDFKGIVSGSNSWVPTYQSFESVSPLSTFNTDDYFGLLNDNEGDVLASNGVMDIAVGRLPIQSLQEGNEIVDKIIRYKTQPFTDTCKTVNQNNSWRTQVTFIADDEDGAVHLSNSEELAEFLRVNYPKYNLDKIYLDSYNQVNTAAGKRYPDATNSLLNKFNAGSLVMNYVGHGSIQRWAHEVLMDQSMINQLDNSDKMPLLVTATCEFSRFDLPERTGGELFLINKKGGAIGLITTTRVVYSSENSAMNNALFSHLFEEVNGRNFTMGELMTRAKNDILSSGGLVNNRKFVLLGDPALTLNYPENNVTTTKINGVELSQPHDTLKAQSIITIEGEIHDDDGNLISDFNGIIYPTVFDKISNITSLGNDGTPSKNYKLYRNIIYKGAATVTNGLFSFTFKVPQDINYAIGEGRISYYAEDGNRDASGSQQQGVVIGGTQGALIPDNEGPIVKLYMGTEAFKDYGITDVSPLMIAKLEDENGINTTGNSIGHDLVVYLDNSPDPIVLNDFYQTELNDFSKGNIRYLFNNLEPGPHQIRVKAWDIYNNSGEGILNFFIVPGGIFEVNNVVNYPNPFSESTTLSFQTNRCCVNFNLKIEIYDVFGQFIKVIDEQRFNDTYRITDITWDGTDENGSKVSSGTYIYRLKIDDGAGSIAIRTNKLQMLNK